MRVRAGLAEGACHSWQTRNRSGRLFRVSNSMYATLLEKCEVTVYFAVFSVPRTRKAWPVLQIEYR